MAGIKFSSNRRALLAAGLAAAAGPLRQAFAQPAAEHAAQDAYIPRIKHALLIGNRAYPNRKDIPPAHKNVADIKEILEFLEFNVTLHVDLGPQAMRAALAQFSSKMSGVAGDSMPGSIATLFYFCGHGFQSEGQNYLVPANVDPSGENVAKQSLKLLDDVLVTMPQRYPGVSIALIDACRTDPSYRREKDDLNQIMAPTGTIIFFATRAGRPALAPIDENRNTFFTSALVETLRSANGVTAVDDLFQVVATRCQDTVRAVFEKAKLPYPPQYPESTVNLRGKFVIRNRLLEEQRQTRRQEIRERPDAARLDARWQAVQDAVRPRALLRLAEDFVRDFPDNEYLQSAQVIIAGAKRALAGQQEAGLTTDALEDKGGDASYRDDLKKALRGDKDSAHRIALMYRDGGNGLQQAPRRLEQWLRFAAELGNGIASWQVAEIYSRQGQQGDAARYERRAVELGYRPPPRLSNRGY